MRNLLGRLRDNALEQQGELTPVGAAVFAAWLALTMAVQWFWRANVRLRKVRMSVQN